MCVGGGGGGDGGRREGRRGVEELKLLISATNIVVDVFLFSTVLKT